MCNQELVVVEMEERTVGCTGLYWRNSRGLRALCDENDGRNLRSGRKLPQSCSSKLTFSHIPILTDLKH